MTRRIIVLSNTEPDKNVFWFKDGQILYYEAGQWLPITSDLGYDLETRLKAIEKELKDLKDYIKGDSPIYITNEDLTNILLQYAKTEDIPQIPTFKTINGESIIGEGNIDVEGGGTTSKPVYTPTMPESTIVTGTIGGISAGTALSELKGKDISNIIDLLLVSEIWDDPKYKHTISISQLPSIVKVGTSIRRPVYMNVWNTNITPVAGVNPVIDASLFVSIPGHNSDSDTDKYDTSGKAAFTLDYSYGEGTYEISSNLGNKKTITVPADKGSITKEVDVTYPWFINTVEQSLVPIGTEFTETVMLDGAPSIKVPFTNSEIKVQADLGFGYMDVEWQESIDNSNLGEAINETVPYKVLTKPDSYNTTVAHKITIKIIK